MAEEETTVNRFRDRVVEKIRMRVGDLRPNPFNPKFHPVTQRQRTMAVLDRVGKLMPLLAYRSERMGGELVMLDGHLRQELNEDEEWDIWVTDLTDDEADEELIFIDATAQGAEWDPAKFMGLTVGREMDDKVLADFLAEIMVDIGLGARKTEAMPGEFPDYENDAITERCCPSCGHRWMIR